MKTRKILRKKNNKTWSKISYKINRDTRTKKIDFKFCWKYGDNWNFVGN